MPENKRYVGWYFVSFLLLIIYLAFFYTLNWTSANSPERVGLVGAGFAGVWMTCCFVCQNVFRNRFEYSIHMLVTLDFVFEGIVPLHSGYGFFLCAAAFWTVFLVYHHLPARQNSSQSAPERVTPHTTPGRPLVTSPDA